MDVNYSAALIDVDRAAREAEAERPGKPVHLRVQPTLMRTKSGGEANHRSWSGVSWTLECGDASEAIAVRRAMEAFFTALERFGPDRVREALTTAVQST